MQTKIITDYIKKNWKLLAVIAFLVVFLGIVAHNSCTSSKELGLIKKDLLNELSGIKKDINDSKTREDALLSGQEDLSQALYGTEKKEGVLSKLDKNRLYIAEIQEKFDQRPAPSDPEKFTSLEQCQIEYQVLSESYALCNELNDSKDSALILFGEVKNNLISQVSLLKGAVGELKSQVKDWEKIEKAVMDSMERLDNAHRNTRFWKNFGKVSVGVGLGALAVLLLKAISK